MILNVEREKIGLPPIKNKIEEILKEMKIFRIEHSHNSYYEYTFDNEEFELLVDYITNLKQEIKQLKEEIKKYINSNDFVYDELYKKREKIKKILGDKGSE